MVEIYFKKIYKNVTGINGPKHLYLSIKNLNNTLNTNKTNYFSKIILSSNPGIVIYMILLLKMKHILKKNH